MAFLSNARLDSANSFGPTVLICSYCWSLAFRRLTPLFCVPHNVFSNQYCKRERRGATFVGREPPRGIALVEEACLSVSNFCRARESSVSKSTDVEEETFKGSFLTLGAASRGSGRCRPRGITHTQTDLRHSNFKLNKAAQISWRTHRSNSQSEKAAQAHVEQY
jgi:hypothetical protein